MIIYGHEKYFDGRNIDYEWGYPDGEEPEAKPRKENYIYKVK